MKNIFIFCIFIIACDRQTIFYQEVCKSNPEQQKWVLECISNGNPMSDEEGEDLVKQCEISSRALFKDNCELKAYCKVNGNLSPIEDCNKR